MKCFLLIRKCVKAIHADDDMKGFVVHLQISDIALNTLDMCMTIKPFSGLFKHIHTIIKTGNLRIFQGNPFVLCKYSRSDRNIKKIS